MEKELGELYRELDKVKSSTDDYLPEYGYQSKDEVIQLINEDIEEAEREIRESDYDYTDEELERERTSLCLSLGISRYC